MSASTMLTTDPNHATPAMKAAPHEVAPDVLMHAVLRQHLRRAHAGRCCCSSIPASSTWRRRCTQAVRAWTDAPLHTAVYTHGHADHAFGLGAFLDAGERPQIIAQENCPRRFRALRAHPRLERAHQQRQFSLPAPLFPNHFDWPTLTFRDVLAQRLGDLEVHYRAAKGETDDALLGVDPGAPLSVHGRSGHLAGAELRQPAEGTALSGRVGRGARRRWPDSTPSGCFPATAWWCGAPTRSAPCSSESARYLRVIIDQVLERLNARRDPGRDLPRRRARPRAGAAPLPRRQLRPSEVHRPQPAAPVGRLVERQRRRPAAGDLGAAGVRAGGTGRRRARRWSKRGRELLAGGDAVLAAHLAEWATRAAPADRAAQELKRDVYHQRLREEGSLMAQGIYRAARDDAKKALGEN